MTLLSETPRCHWCRWVELRGITDSEHYSAVSLMPLSRTLEYHWCRWVGLCSIIDASPQYHDTAEWDSGVSLMPMRGTLWFQGHRWLGLRSIIDASPRYHWHRWVRLHSTVSLTPNSHYVRCHWHFGVHTSTILLLLSLFCNATVPQDLVVAFSIFFNVTVPRDLVVAFSIFLMRQSRKIFPFSNFGSPIDPVLRMNPRQTISNFKEIKSIWISKLKQ